MNTCIEQLIRRHPELQGVEKAVLEAGTAITDSFRSGGKLLLCGNGGSAADADHIAGELLKSFKMKRPLSPDLAERFRAVDPELGAALGTGLQQGLPAINLCMHNALHTAFANDMDYINVYAQMTLAIGKPGDVLLGISTSGNSSNVLRAFTVARALHIRTIGLTGARHGRMDNMADIAICVPATETDRIQELHLPVYHAICELIEQNMFEE